MQANKILLQRKYSRIIEGFAQKSKIPLRDALHFFYYSDLYSLVSQGISDMHCRSDKYLIEELIIEKENFKPKG